VNNFNSHQQTKMNNEIFEDLFVLELANNHLGDLQRGLQIIKQHGQVVRFNGVRATIKLQFRDVENFIHKDYRDRTDIKYIKKTADTKMSKEQYAILLEAIKRSGCLTSATPFDEASVALCEELNVDLIKLASSDLNDWFLIERIARAGKPVIASTGGSNTKDIDDLVKFFKNRNIPLALNHCVSMYPSEDSEIELNQIDYLRYRYPGLVIGLSTHEYTDWFSSMLIAYGKGARTFERHIDIEYNGVEVTPYNSLPHQIDTWFKAFQKAKEMSGGNSTQRRNLPKKEVTYLDALVRGVYAKRDLPAGYEITQHRILEDFYLAIPLLKGQLSCRELMDGEVLNQELGKDQPLKVNYIEGAYASNPSMQKLINERGV
jgi:sialic acid synthase SpsE